MAEKGSDGAGRGAERNEDDGEAGDECERGGEESGAGWLALTQLFHADAREHRDVAGDQGQNAGREEGDQAGEEGSQE